MNFLALCQAVREKAGISGTGPVTVIKQQGEMLRIVNWVNDAWEELQNLNENWKWMRQEFTFQTTAMTRAYPPLPIVADHTQWHEETLRCYKTSDGVSTEQFMSDMKYGDFRDSYMFGAMSTMAGRPMIFAQRDRDKALMLGPLPDGIYTIYGEYQQAATRMAADTDLPALGGFPTEYQMAIVHLAVMKYAIFEGAGALFQSHQEEYRKILRALERDQLEDVALGEALA